MVDDSWYCFLRCEAILSYLIARDKDGDKE